MKSYEDYRTKEGDRIVEQYNPRNDIYDFEGNIYQDNTNAKAEAL